MNKQLFFKVEFHSSIEEKREIRLNVTQKLLLSLFNSNFELNYNENIPKMYNLKESTIIINLRELVKLKVLEKNNKGSYKIVEDLRENFDSNKGFYIDTVLFSNPKLTPTSILIYSFFGKYKENGFALWKNGFKQYIKCTDRVTYKCIELLISENLLKKEKTGIGKQFKYYALPYNITPNEIPSEEIEEEVEEELIVNEEIDVLKIENEQLKAELEKINNRLSNATIEYKKLRDNYNDLVFKYQELQKENERLKQHQIKNNPKPQYTPKPQPTKNNAPYNITQRMVELIKNLIKNVVLKYCNYNERYNNSAYQDLYNYLNTVQVDESLKNEEFNNDCYTYREDIAKQEGLKYEVQFAGELVKRSLKQIVENKGRCQQQEIIQRLEKYYKKIL